MSGAGLLLLRGGGCLWGVPDEEVERLEGERDRVTLRLRRGSLIAEAVLGVARAVRIHPAGASLRRFWPEPCGGLAVHDGRPLVVVDVARPPRALRDTEGEVGNEHAH
ncbi:MAG: hypothetical protein ACOY3Y_06020 [Acidobacteriota bacterium]